MSDVMNAGVVLSLVAGTVAGTLGLLAWWQFRGTPFGRLVSIVPVVYAGFIGFHAFLLVSGQGHGPGHSPHGGAQLSAVNVFETLAFAGLAVFTLQAIRLHGRMSRRSGGNR